MSVYEVVNGFSWITLTKLKHLYTVLNMIVHLWGRVLLYSLRAIGFPSAIRLN